jgi:mRNA-degrading endonuclease RelE of RelBE toxin-antitoxin system
MPTKRELKKRKKEKKYQNYINKLKLDPVSFYKFIKNHKSGYKLSVSDFRIINTLTTDQKLKVYEESGVESFVYTDENGRECVINKSFADRLGLVGDFRSEKQVSVEKFSHLNKELFVFGKDKNDEDVAIAKSVLEEMGMTPKEAMEEIGCTLKEVL